MAVQSRHLMGLGIFSLCTAASTAMGGFIPAVSINLQVSDGGGLIFDQTVNPAGAPQGPFGYQFSYNIVGANFSAYGDVNVNPSPTQFFNGFLNTVTHANNNTGQSLTFAITITGDIDMAAVSPMDWTMGSTWTVDGPLPTASTVAPFSLATGFLNGSQIATLYDHPTGMGGGINPLNLNAAPVSGTLLGGASSAGLVFVFELSGNNNTITTNSEIYFVPAPAGLALLAAAGLVGPSRRRRRSE